MDPADKSIINRWKQEPAPLLPILHQFQERDGYLSEQSLETVSQALAIPLSEFFGIVSFYHFFRLSPVKLDSCYVCDGPVCSLDNRQGISQKENQIHSLPCIGYCDLKDPLLRKEKGFDLNIESSSRKLPTLPLHPHANEFLFKHIRVPQISELKTYRKNGGYQALEKVLAGNNRENIIRSIQESGLTGKGGAGFPTGTKLQLVAEQTAEEKVVICNADEGEPGCFKDRTLLFFNPHLVIEGMILSAFAVGADLGFIYLRYEYPEVFAVLQTAISEAEESGYLGADILGSSSSFKIHLRRGAGAYICGEESALINSLEGKLPHSRKKPPYPVSEGFEGNPTLVNNVETFANIPLILQQGAEAYKNLGIGNNSGTKIISLSGDVQNPGCYEIPVGLTLKELIFNWAGGISGGRNLQAVTMSGISGGMLSNQALDLNLDENSLRSMDSTLGTGGIIVLDDSRNLLAFMRNVVQFYMTESCGKCFSCKFGTQQLNVLLEPEKIAAEKTGWLLEFNEVCDMLKEFSECGLGTSVPVIMESWVNNFSESPGSA